MFILIDGCSGIEPMNVTLNLVQPKIKMQTQTLLYVVILQYTLKALTHSYLHSTTKICILIN
jgi:hypothetical protein